VPEEGTAAVLAAREGQRGVEFHSCWPLRGPEWGEMHSRVGKYSFHDASQRKKLCDKYSALGFRLNNLSS